MPMLAQEQQQAQRYTEEEQDDDDEEDDEPQHEEEPEEWMLLCRLNQQYDQSVSQENPTQQNFHFDWTTAGRTMPPGLVRDSANWITKRRNEAGEDPTVVHRRQHQPVNPEQLNVDQRLAFNIVAMHHDALNSETPNEPLRMIITGTAGSGKSFLINALMTILRDKCKLTGTTGIAGYNIRGCTLHSALQLPVCNHNNSDLQRQALQRLQLRFTGKHYLITDEMSMLGQRTLAWVDKRLRQATGKLNEPLGGISMILLGDFAQLPPVGDKPIYATSPSSILGQHGYSIYTLFETVVMLRQNIRQAGNNPEAEVFREILMRMRNGQSTQCDWQKLCERTPQHINMDNFKDAPRLFFDKASVANYNYDKLSNLANPVARISAVHSGRNAKAATSDDAGGLDAVIFLARGAAVMLTCNLWQEVGLCNGASGVVHDLIFHPERPPPCLPIAALVDFQHYTGPPFLHTHPQIVPIPPHLFEWETEGQRLSRQQLPLRLSYAMTIHKSQGQTLSTAVIDLAKAERAAGCSFVALSRVRSLDNVVLQPLSFQRLQAIAKSKQLQQRLREEERLQQLADIIARQHQHRH